MLLTIFTPTYNRATTIKRTYESLCRQSWQDFEWLIIDDGSTDDTCEVVRSFISENRFPIIYVKKENGGKHTAYNEALQLAKGDLFFIVDSDDWVPDNCVSSITKYTSQLFIDDHVIGIIALKENQNSIIIGRRFPENLHQSTLRSLELSGNGGERSMVLKTSHIRQFKFPIVKDEHFMPEGVVYDRFCDYNFIISNSVLTTCEYQQDGLSSSPYKLMLDNPGGYMIYYRNRINLASSLVERLNYILRYHSFRHLSRGKDISKYSGEHVFLTKVLELSGRLGAFYYRLKLKKWDR